MSGVLFIGLLLSGCVPPSPFRAVPDFQDRARAIKTVVLLPPRVEVFQVDAGGVKEKMDDWTAQAKKNIVDAVQEEIRSTGNMATKVLPDGSFSEEEKASLEETEALFDAVSTSVRLHTYDPQGEGQYLFKEKIKNFDYSLGPEVQRLPGQGSDSLLVVTAVDHVWTGGRKALQAVGIILGLAAGAATHVAVVPVLGGGTALTVALVDAHSGSILWYDVAASGSGYDLRDAASASGLVKELFKDFPGSGSAVEQ